MIETRKRRDRNGRAYRVYRVRAAGVDRTLPRGTTRAQAEQWETKVKQLAQTGELGQLDAGNELLADFVAEWWETYATVHLAHATLATYKVIWEKHLLPRIGGHRLRELHPQVIDELVADLAAAGVGKPTIRKALGLLQGVLRRAVEWRRLHTNPMLAVTKPRVVRQHVVRVLTPSEVEAIRAELEHRDATIVSCLAYSGPRPGELLQAALCWPDVGKRTLLYRQPKTSRPPRPVRLIGPLVQDLREWQLAQGRISQGPVFPNADGEAWSDQDWRSWRRYRFQPAAERAGVDIGRPYDLRHTWASLLLQEQKLSDLEVAAQLGHSMQTLWANYSHIIGELAGEPLDLEQAIRDARDDDAEKEAL